MDNKRNYYRILQVQPDAPAAVIRHNYLLLLKKLGIHPDLGGDGKEAARINEAYETLRDPDKRGRYDRQLLLQNDMAALSLGHLKPRWWFLRKKTPPFSPHFTNRRNYYRILQVQPDAHPAVIRERYRAMLAAGSKTMRALLHEAYLVLNNPEKRMAYDRLLKRLGHSAAVRKMNNEAASASDPSNAAVPGFESNPGLIPPGGRITYPQPPFFPSALQPGKPADGEYPLPDTPFCIFCKTPHGYSAKGQTGKMCIVCNSPLTFSEPGAWEENKRRLDRIRKNGDIVFYVCWPGREMPGKIFDISPAGLGFHSKYGTDPGQIIKIDAQRFKAVGEVVHAQIRPDRATSIGVSFRSACFTSPAGNFLDLSA